MKNFPLDSIFWNFHQKNYKLDIDNLSTNKDHKFMRNNINNNDFNLKKSSNNLSNSPLHINDFIFNPTNSNQKNSGDNFLNL